MAMSMSVAARLFEASYENNIPVEVVWELTKLCNQRCRHCYIPDFSGSGELKFGGVRRVLEELKAEGCLYVTFTGGEIFLRDDIFEIIEEARRMNFAVTLFSNLTLMRDTWAERLAGLKIAEVAASLYSTSAVRHDGMTRAPGSHARTVRGAKMLLTAGVPVRFKTPLFAGNFAGYAEIRKFAKSVGARCSFDPVISPRDDGGRAPLAMRPDGGQLREFYSDPKIMPAAAAKSGSMGRAAFLRNFRRAGPPVQRAAFLSRPCSAGRNFLGISSAGDVYPCLQFPVRCGNLKGKSFGDIWRRSRKILEVRNFSLDRLRGCASCRLFNDCQRCPGVAHLEHGDWKAPSMEACRQAAVIREVKNRHAEQAA